MNLEGLEYFGGSFGGFRILMPKNFLCCSILIEVYIKSLKNPNKLATFTPSTTALFFF